MMPPIRLLLVDDHPIVRDGLRGAFAGAEDIMVVGEAANGLAALEIVAAQPIDVVLLDLRMPELDGVATIRALAEQAPQVRVLVLTTFDSDRDIVAAVEAGATGYLLKDTPRATLLEGVRATAQGAAVLSPVVAQRLMSHVRAPLSEQLSEREQAVLALIAQGANNREIALQLFVSEATIKTHLQHLYAKLDVNDRAGAVGEAYRRGILH